METNNWTDELEGVVREWMDDIISDRLEGIDVKDKELRVIDSGTDDGIAYGTFHILVNGGRFVIELTANGAYAGFQDCWSWSNDSHYTRDVTFDQLEDLEYDVKSVVDTEKAIDNIGDQELNLREEK